MKKILSITLLITAIIFASCKEEESLRVQKSIKKDVKTLSYSFNANRDASSVKSGHVSDSIKPINKVLATEEFKVNGESFIAMLIEESDPILTKADNPQTVAGSSIYTFYKYQDSEIKEQTIGENSKTFFVPQDDATNYGIIFLSSADGMGNPNTITSPTINTAEKEITYQASFNENVCYAVFDRNSMPSGNPIEVTFKPVFSQLSLSVPTDLAGETVTVESVKLMGGAQETAIIKAKYNPKATSNIEVTYQGTKTDVPMTLDCKVNGNATIFTDTYYNLISNGNPARLSIRMTVKGKTQDKTFNLKNNRGESITFEGGKRYKLSIALLSISIEPKDLTLVKGRTGTLTATVKMSDGSNPTTGFDWKFSPTGIVDVVGSSNGSSISLKGANVGSTTVTVTYLGNSATAAVNVDWTDYTFTNDDYYQWNAFEPYGTPSTGKWEEGSSDYDPTNYGTTTGNPLSRGSCKDCPCYDNMRKYLSEDVYWDDAGPEYTINVVVPYEGTYEGTYRTGLWIKKKAYLSYSNPSKKERKPVQMSALSTTQANEIRSGGKYFFLPACGHFGSSGSFYYDGTYYWLSTPNPSNTNYAYIFYFDSGNARVNAFSNRNPGFVPMPSL